ncbi:MAG: ATP-binding protein [Planctomycetaceae bacterium]
MNSQQRGTQVLQGRIVYVGPAGAGTTTTLSCLHGLLDPDGRTRLYSLVAPDGRTLFFDLLALEDFPFAGERLRPMVLGLPGGPERLDVRRAGLAAADAVVFVADSARASLDATAAAYREVESLLREAGQLVKPVLAFNRQDVDDLVSTSGILQAIGRAGSAAFTTVATTGAGLLDCFGEAMRRLLARVGTRHGLSDADALAALPGRYLVGGPRERRGAPSRALEERRFTIVVPETAGDECASAVEAQIALANHHARADDANRLLEERNRELMAINRVGRSLLTSMDPDNLLVVLLDSTADLLRASHASCVIFDPGEKGKMLTHVTGFGRDPALGLAREPAQEFLRLLADSDAPVPLSKDRNPQLLASLRLVDGRVERALFAPVKNGEKLAGWMGIYCFGDEPFPGTQGILFYSSISRLAALGLEKIALLQAARRVQTGLEAEVKDRTSKLEMANAKIRALNRGLEARVAERTRALEDANRALREARAAAVHSARLTGMGRLAASFAHEVNNPLSGLHANLAFMRDGLDELRARLAVVRPEIADGLKAISEYRQAIDESLQAAARISGIIASLKRFGGEGAESRFSLNASVADAVTLLEERLRGCAELDLRLGVLGDLRGDAKEMSHMVLALLTNAVEAVERTGKRGSIVVTTFCVGERVTLTIKDSGAGVDASVQARMFEPFVSTKEGEPCAGLGLHAAYVALQRLGGEIRLAGKAGQGTTVTVELPLPAEVPA